MTNKQIDALAQEYAIEATKADASDPNISATELNKIRHDIEDYMKGLIRWLSERHCIKQACEDTVTKALSSHTTLKNHSK